MAHIYSLCTQEASWSKSTASAAVRGMFSCAFSLAPSDEPELELRQFLCVRIGRNRPILLGRNALQPANKHAARMKRMCCAAGGDHRNSTSLKRIGPRGLPGGIDHSSRSIQ
jgi:hypothetical protein